MTLRSSNPRVYERILAYGMEGSGKTKNWLDVAKLAQKTGSDAQFYVCDTDFAVPRMLSGETFGMLENVHDEQVDNWRDLVNLVRTYRDKIRPQDWLVIDMLSWAWGWVQDEYIERAYKQTTGEKWMSWATSGVKGGILEGDRDWGTINKNFAELSGMLMRLQGNVFCTAGAKAVTDRDSADSKALYERHGAKPTGQKDTGHLFHTILYCRNTGTSEWRLTSVKDRERQLMEGEVVKDFAMSYLVRRAGWRP